MLGEQLGRVDGNWLHLQIAGESEFYDQASAAALAPRLVSRIIRGHKSRTAAALFDEMAAALQFPPYFGENWNALDDCLSDLEWLPGEAYALWITRARQLLKLEPDSEFAMFCQVLGGAAAWWRKAAPAESRPARPFHVVLQADPADEDLLRQRLADARVSFDVWTTE